MITVTLYSREGCQPCEQVRADLDALQGQYPHQLVLVNVDTAPDLRQAYGAEVPVVEVGPYTLRAPIRPAELQMTLAAAAERKQHLEAIHDPTYAEAVRRGQEWSKLDSFAYWLSRHYLAVFNLFVLIYVGLPFLAPALMAAGAQAPARLIYRSYGLVCHQLAYRSFFLFGEQAAYPRAAAGVPGVLTYEQATGYGGAATSNDIITAREFVGNPAIGYKVALCERDVAIYGAILLFGLLFSLTGRRIPAIPWYAWIAIGILPIAVDGLSQFISQPPFNLMPFRESTPLLRVLTGGLFGFTTAWFGYPLVEESMADTRQIMAKKLIRLKGKPNS
jgi:uncharacterized membrane protein